MKMHSPGARRETAQVAPLREFTEKEKQMRTLHGGSNSRAIHFGPRVVREGYSTTANGWADTIQANAGEVAVMIFHGGPSSFATWLVGTPEEVCTELTRKAAWEGYRNDLHMADRFRHLAQSIAKQAAEGGSQGAAKVVATEYRRMADELDSPIPAAEPPIW